MIGDELGAAIADLRPVELGELDAVARLLTRRDRKYIVPLADAERLVRTIAPAARALGVGDRRLFAYRSVYFDTPDLRSYLAAARRRPRRYKVRTRAYLDSGGRLLEIKHRDGAGRTVKDRIEHLAIDADALDEEGIAFLRSCPLIGPDAVALRPVLSTEYLRSTLLTARHERVTIDIAVRARSRDGRTAGLAGMAVIETKSLRAPTEADRILWRLGHRPVRVSKYCTSLAVLHPSLPSNAWTRALQRPWVVTPDGRPGPIHAARATEASRTGTRSGPAPLATATPSGPPASRR